MTLATLFRIPVSHHLLKRARSAVALFCCLALTPQLQAAWQTPLNAEEIQNAASAVTSQVTSKDKGNFVAPVDRGSNTETRTINSAGNLQHPLGVQVLLVELKEQKQPVEQATRIAEVFIFNYQLGVAQLNLFDVEKNQLISTREIPSAHLPLSEQEIEYSKTLIWNNAEFRERIQTEYESFATVPDSTINSIETMGLQTRVSIWVPNRNAGSQSELCVQQRCALISLFSEENHSFSIEPVISLMSGQIYLDLVQ